MGDLVALLDAVEIESVAVHAAAVDGDIERQYLAWCQQPGVAESYVDRLPGPSRRIFCAAVRR